MFNSVEIEILILDLSSLILALWNSLGTSWKLILIFTLIFWLMFVFVYYLLSLMKKIFPKIEMKVYKQKLMSYELKLLELREKFESKEISKNRYLLLSNNIKEEIHLTNEYKKLMQFKDLLEKCLALDPKNRLSPEEALMHPFINIQAYKKN